MPRLGGDAFHARQSRHDNKQTMAALMQEEAASLDSNRGRIPAEAVSVSPGAQSACLLLSLVGEAYCRYEFVERRC